MTPSLDQAIHAATHEKWLSYWKRCRIQSIWHKFPDYSDEYNPLWIRWREIPEGEDVTVKHPEIEIQQMETPLNTECYRALMKSLPKGSDWGTKEAIEKATQYYHENQLKKEKEFEEFVEYKKNGNLKIETIDETKPISWESIRDASTEELFQTKLEIFESPPVQESENKEYRSNIRKSASIIEAMYWYYLIVNDIKESSGPAEEKLPENIDLLLEDVSSDAIFKWKLQIFEKEHVQNSKDKKARAEIRKATNLVELFSAYSKIT